MSHPIQAYVRHSQCLWWSLGRLYRLDVLRKIDRCVGNHGLIEMMHVQRLWKTSQMAGRSQGGSFWSNLLGLQAPREKYSLEELQHLHEVLRSNSTVTDQNRSSVVEALRAISELMIWGDQHDPLFFEFFLENNLMRHFTAFLEKPANRRGDVAKQASHWAMEVVSLKWKEHSCCMSRDSRQNRPVCPAGSSNLVHSDTKSTEQNCTLLRLQ